MTRDEIKANVTVPEVLERYGVDIRHNRCKGFCHNGRDYNMAVSQTSCHCFVCNQSFDVFGVVQFFEGCDFRKAFEILGGNKPVSFKARRKAIERKSALAKKDAVQSKESKLFELYRKMDYVIIRYNQTDKPSELLTNLYIYAIKNIERVKFEIDSR